MSYNPTVWQNNSGPAINAANLNKMEQGIEAAHNGPHIIVAAYNAPAEIKARAHYVCNRSNDQVEINLAIEAAALDGGIGAGSVLLTAGEFRVSAPIRMRSRVTLQGVGWGTELEAHNNNQSVIALHDDDVYMTMLYNFTIRGRANRSTAHGVHYRQPRGNFGSIAAPDAVHRFIHLNIHRVGGRAIYLEGLDNGGGRGTRIIACRLRGSEQTALEISSFSDSHIEGCDINTQNNSMALGIVVGGGNTVIQNTKVWYTGGDGVLISSSRAMLSSVLAQDCGGNGFTIDGHTAMLSGCVADSCSRLTSNSAGFDISGRDATLDGIKVYDRFTVNNDVDNRTMSFGIRFQSGVRTYLTGGASNCITSTVAGSPGAGSYVRVVTDDQGLYAVG